MFFGTKLAEYNEYYDNIKDPWQFVGSLIFVLLFITLPIMKGGLIVYLSILFVSIIAIIRIWYLKKVFV